MPDTPPAHSACFFAQPMAAPTSGLPGAGWSLRRGTPPPHGSCLTRRLWWMQRMRARGTSGACWSAQRATTCAHGTCGCRAYRSAGGGLRVRTLTCTMHLLSWQLRWEHRGLGISLHSSCFSVGVSWVSHLPGLGFTLGLSHGRSLRRWDAWRRPGRGLRRARGHSRGRQA